MKKIIITGFSGFVSSHFMDYLYEFHPSYRVYGISLEKPTFDYKKYKDRMEVSFNEMNLMESDGL